MSIDTSEAREMAMTDPVGGQVPVPYAANRLELTPLTFLARAGVAFHERVAVREEDQTFTFGEFQARCHQLGSVLRRCGIRKGARVAVLAPNSHELLEAHFGVPLAGGTLVAINTRLAQDEIGYILRDASARVLIVDAEFYQAVDSLIDDLPELAHVIVARATEVQRESGRRSKPTFGSYELLLEDCRGAWLEPDLDEDDPISINYTSGTTGVPKGAVYSHRGAYLNAISVAFEIRLGPDSVYLWTLPMFHCNGWSYGWGTIAAGATNLIVRRVDPGEVWRLIDSADVTHFCAAPTVLIALANDPSARDRASRRSVVRAVTGGAPPSPTTIEQMRGLGVDITHLYGMTETYGPSLACTWWPEWDALPDAQQAAYKARQGIPTLASGYARVVDAQSRDVPADGQTLGELVIRGNTVMRGYLGDPAATAQAFRNGWFHTGDLGVMHADGYIELRDRAKDVVISGGENVSTIQIEQLLARHPAVVEAAVIGIPDDRWGEVPKAFVTLKPGASVSADEIIDFCRSHLAHFKAPKSVEFGALPKTSTGKVQKFLLREREWAGRDRRIS